MRTLAVLVTVIGGPQLPSRTVTIVAGPARLRFAAQRFFVFGALLIGEDLASSG